MRQSSIHQPMTPDLGRVALRQHEQKRSSASDIRRQVIVLLSEDGIDTRPERMPSAISCS